MPTTAEYIDLKIVRGRDGKYFIAATADSAEPLFPILFNSEAEARALVEKLNKQLDSELWRRN